MTSAKTWARLLNLRKDQDDPASIDAQIQHGVNAAGTNLWVLIFAILVASIGLNVNSTAVIIGAMLISPLMGPIVGIGYGAGIGDFELIRRAAINLALMTGISLLTATLYFTLTPLHSAYSELLARTQPTIWDVLIAFLGGAAGIVATTRKSISNAVPGVAIATALMPPLCTSGFGIANGNWAYASGAFYLFTINGVFIALATLLFVRIMRLPQKTEVDAAVASRHRLLITLVALVTAVPSLVLAYRLVDDERFQGEVRSVLSGYNQDSRVVILSTDIDGKARSVHLIASGELEAPALQGEIIQRLAVAGISDAEVVVRGAGQSIRELQSIQNNMREQLFADRDRQLADARQRLATLESENSGHRRRSNLERSLLDEVAAQFPGARRIDVGTGWSIEPAQADPAPVLVVHVAGLPALDDAERARLVAGWQQRFPDYRVQLDERAASEAQASESEDTPVVPTN